MKKASLMFCALPLTFLVAPQRCVDYVNNTRIFVEGRVTSAGQPVAFDSINLSSDYITISKGITKQDGSFELAGPGTSAEKQLNFGRKISSMQSSVAGCEITYDSMSIMIPQEVSYVKFSNIDLKP